jgi:hypothetical protein
MVNANENYLKDPHQTGEANCSQVKD